MPVSTPAALVAAAPTLFRQGLLALFREKWPRLALTLTAEAAHVTEFVAHRPFALVVLDGLLPDRVLVDLLVRLRYSRPRLRLLLLSDHPPATQFELPLAWPDTWLHLPRHVPPAVLADALDPWLDQLQGLKASRRPKNGTHQVAEEFSPREMEVLRLVVEDHCNEEIANQLFINVRTVESHRRNLLQKAGTRTLVGLAARAVREGWVA